MGYVRQAVVVVHGMGEQLPLSTLTRFINTALEPDARGEREYYSRPESVTGSFESRRFLAPVRKLGDGSVRPQTEFFEYHWADKMQGNRIDDLWPTFRRLMMQWPTRVPRGLGWVAILFVAWASVWGPLADKVFGYGNVVTAMVGLVVSSGVTAAIVSYLLARVLPGWLTGSFVDVVRYLDTSPRSYAVRREIRRGLVEMLQALNGANRYDRVIVVAHSLGAFIAYDAIAYLWGLTNAATNRKPVDLDLPGLVELEQAASNLPDAGPASEAPVDAFQAAQRELWRGIRSQGNPWLVTDFVSVGTPMYFADQLMHGKAGRSFAKRVQRRELPTCPPANEETTSNNINNTKRFYSWEKKWWTGKGADRRQVHHRVLHEGASFAVVRWTNVFFPIKLGFFGDWFGGPLAPLFGAGIKDVEITGNTLGKPSTRPWLNRLVPAAAHSFYFSFPDDSDDGSAVAAIRSGMSLASTSWARTPLEDELDD